MAVRERLTSFDTMIEKAKLRKIPHQRDGVEWCLRNELSTHAKKGGIIADEMGLGKTITMIGTIICNFKLHTLIVVPLALLDQWVSEFLKVTGHRVMVYHGNDRKYITIDEIRRAPVVITTYDIVARGGGMLRSVMWDRGVFDEAHALRNQNTGRHKGAKKLNISVKWLISGTPIQNRKSDFYSLCEIIGLSSDYYTNDANLSDLAKRHLLKRTKKEVGIELPSLNEGTLNVEWKHEGEKELSEEFHSMLNFSNVTVKKTSSAIGILNGNSALPILLRARQSCILPSLFGNKLRKYMDDGIIEHDEKLIEATNHHSKIDSVVGKILERKDNGLSKIVFCHFHGEIDIIKKSLREKGLYVESFDGRTPKDKRSTIFTEQYDVLILQIQTACEGLNLQQYNEIYFVSPHWNPAVEDQAIARCHRIGQQKKVYVFRFIMESNNKEKTIDQYCSDIQQNKRKIREMLEINK